MGTLGAISRKREVSRSLKILGSIDHMGTLGAVGIPYNIISIVGESINEYFIRVNSYIVLLFKVNWSNTKSVLLCLFYRNLKLWVHQAMFIF